MRSSVLRSFKALEIRRRRGRVARSISGSALRESEEYNTVCTCRTCVWCSSSFECERASVFYNFGFECSC